MSVKQQILDALKPTEGTTELPRRTSRDIAMVIDRPGPSVRRTLSQMENAGLLVAHTPNYGRQLEFQLAAA